MFSILSYFLFFFFPYFSFWPPTGQSLVEVNQELKSSVGSSTLNVKEITEIDLDYNKAAAFRGSKSFFFFF